MSKQDIRINFSRAR